MRVTQVLLALRVKKRSNTANPPAIRALATQPGLARWVLQHFQPWAVTFGYLNDNVGPFPPPRPPPALVEHVHGLQAWIRFPCVIHFRCGSASYAKVVFQRSRCASLACKQSIVFLEQDIQPLARLATARQWQRDGLQGGGGAAASPTGGCTQLQHSGRGQWLQIFLVCSCSKPNCKLSLLRNGCCLELSLALHVKAGNSLSCDVCMQEQTRASASLSDCSLYVVRKALWQASARKGSGRHLQAGAGAGSSSCAAAASPTANRGFASCAVAASLERCLALHLHEGWQQWQRPDLRRLQAGPNI